MNRRLHYPPQVSQKQNNDPYGIGAGAGILIILICLFAFVDWYMKQKRPVKIVVAIIVLAPMLLGKLLDSSIESRACTGNLT